jgi:hypothetical protein
LRFVELLTIRVPVTIERLRPGDGERLRAIRLRSLQDAPEVFATTWEEAAGWSLETWNRHLEERPTFIATARGSDHGLVRGARNEQVPDTAYLISMWVAPEASPCGWRPKRDAGARARPSLTRSLSGPELKA